MADLKPHKGSIKDWTKMEVNPKPIKGQKHLGYLIMGQFMNHPDFGSKFTNTSVVVSHHADGEIETLNSRYTLVGDEIKR